MQPWLYLCEDRHWQMEVHHAIRMVLAHPQLWTRLLEAIITVQYRKILVLYTIRKKWRQCISLPAQRGWDAMKKRCLGDSVSLLAPCHSIEWHCSAGADMKQASKSSRRIEQVTS